MKNELTHEQSLSLITEMISQAKRNVAKGGSTQILMWGVVIAFANFAHYTLANIGYSAPYIVWLVTIPTAIASAILGYRMGKSGATGHLDSIYGQTWIAIGVGIAGSLAMMSRINYFHNVFILLLAGIGMYITGRLLRFRPIVFGSFVLWIAAIVCFNLPMNDQYLVAGIAILLGYIVPGYLLKRAESE